MSENKPDDQSISSFEKATQQQVRPGVVSDLWHFIKDNRKWWLVPLIIILLGVGLVTFLSSTAAGPFLYTLF